VGKHIFCLIFLLTTLVVSPAVTAQDTKGFGLLFVKALADGLPHGRHCVC